jgi:hypothetical protein
MGLKIPFFESMYIENADKLSKAYAILFEAIARRQAINHEHHKTNRNICASVDGRTDNAAPSSPINFPA